MIRINLLEKEKKKEKPNNIKQHGLSIALGASLFFSGIVHPYFNPVNLLGQVRNHNLKKQYELIQDYHLGKELAKEFHLKNIGNKKDFNLAQQQPNYFSLIKSDDKLDVNPDFINYLHAKQKPDPKPAVLDTIEAKAGEYVMVVNKETQQAELYKIDYVLIDKTKVSTGKNLGEKQISGDHKTPTGVFEVVSVQKSTDWTFYGEYAYGPYAARLNCGSWSSMGNHNPSGRSSIMVHGTHEPEKLGKRASHGCIRLEDNIDKEYVENGYIREGTRVVIINDINHIPTPTYLIADLSKKTLSKPSPNPDYEVECSVNFIRPKTDLEGIVDKNKGEEHYTTTTSLPDPNKKGTYFTNKSIDEILSESQAVLDRIDRLLYYDNGSENDVEKTSDKKSKKGNIKTKSKSKAKTRAKSNRGEYKQ